MEDDLEEIQPFYNDQEEVMDDLNFKLSEIRLMLDQNGVTPLARLAWNRLSKVYFINGT